MAWFGFTLPFGHFLGQRGFVWFSLSSVLAMHFISIYIYIHISPVFPCISIPYSYFDPLFPYISISHIPSQSLVPGDFPKAWASSGLVGVPEELGLTVTSIRCCEYGHVMTPYNWNIIWYHVNCDMSSMFQRKWYHSYLVLVTSNCNYQHVSTCRFVQQALALWWRCSARSSGTSWDGACNMGLSPWIDRPLETFKGGTPIAGWFPRENIGLNFGW